MLKRQQMRSLKSCSLYKMLKTRTRKTQFDFETSLGKKSEWYPAGAAMVTMKRGEFDRMTEVIHQQISKFLRVLPKDSGLHAHYNYVKRIIDVLQRYSRILSKGRSTQGYMLNWGSEKKTFAENEEAFKNFDHMLEFDHVSYQMCVPRTSAKSET
ncbi:hypothetical protein T4D_12539, partial [Trichinella pseudospiralis]